MADSPTLGTKEHRDKQPSPHHEDDATARYSCTCKATYRDAHGVERAFNEMHWEKLRYVELVAIEALWLEFLKHCHEGGIRRAVEGLS